MAHIYNPSTQETMVERVPQVQGQPELWTEYEAKQGHIVRPYLEKTSKTKQKVSVTKETIARCDCAGPENPKF